MEFTVERIGTIHAGERGFEVRVSPGFRPALEGLAGFSHVNVLWWFDRCDHPAARARRTEERPYARGPERLGVFATRSPQRPNPVALSCAQVLGLDLERGVLTLDYLDAEDGSPVLDLKPYTPSLDRVAAPAVPCWCAHWPDCTERSGEFDWAAEFCF